MGAGPAIGSAAGEELHVGVGDRVAVGAVGGQDQGAEVAGRAGDSGLEVSLAGVDIADRNGSCPRRSAPRRRRIFGHIGDHRGADHGGVVGAVDGEADELAGAVGGRHREGVDMGAGPAIGSAAGEELHVGVGDRVAVGAVGGQDQGAEVAGRAGDSGLEVSLAGVDIADRNRSATAVSVGAAVSSVTSATVGVPIAAASLVPWMVKLTSWLVPSAAVTVKVSTWVLVPPLAVLPARNCTSALATE